MYAHFTNRAQATTDGSAYDALEIGDAFSDNGIRIT